MEYYNFANKILLILFILTCTLLYKVKKVKVKDYRRRFRYLIYECVIVIVAIPTVMVTWSPSFSSLESAARHSGITIENSPMMKGRESVMILERKDEGGFASSLYYENKGRWKNKWLNPWAKDFYRIKKFEDSLVYEIELVRDGTTEGRYIILHLENQENEEKGKVTDTLGTRFLSAVNKKRWGIQKIYCAYLKEAPPADYQIFLNGNKINIDWKQFRLKDKKM